MSMINTCCMCNDKDGWTTVDIPREFVKELDGGEIDDIDSYSPVVRVPLCEDCAEISERMVTEYQTSPLSEWSHSGVRANFQPFPVESKLEQTIVEAVHVLQQLDDDRIMSHKKRTAKIVAFEAANRGLLAETNGGL